MPSAAGRGRSFMRASIAELEAQVIDGAASATLTQIAAELEHRSSARARGLAERVATMLKQPGRRDDRGEVAARHRGPRALMADDSGDAAGRQRLLSEGLTVPVEGIGPVTFLASTSMSPNDPYFEIECDRTQHLVTINAHHPWAKAHIDLVNGTVSVSLLRTVVTDACTELWARRHSAFSPSAMRRLRDRALRVVARGLGVG